LALLGVLVGITAGVALAAFAGARRTDSALDRLRQATDAHDVTVFTSTGGYFDPDFTELSTRPEVEKLGVWRLLFGDIDGESGGVLFAYDEGRWMGEPESKLVVAGRMYDPASPTEVVVSESLLDEVPIGTKATFTAASIEQLAENDNGPARGPAVELTVVGAIRTVNQFLFTDEIYVSPGYLGKYGDDIASIPNADVQLRDPIGDVDDLRRDVAETIGPGVPLFDLNTASRRVDTTLGVESSALMLLAGVIAIAGGLLVAQALGRSAAVIDDDAPSLMALGMTRRQVTIAGTRSHVIPMAVSAAVMLTTAILASQIFPVGLGRRVDPDVGVHAYWGLLIAGVVVMELLIVGAVSWSVQRTASLRRRSSPATVPRLVSAVRRQAPVSVGLGTTMAFDSGLGARRLPVRPALIAAVVGIAGIVGSLTINRGIDETLAHPERAGVAWDIEVRQPAPLDPGQRFDGAWVSSVQQAAGPSFRMAQLSRSTVTISGLGVLGMTASSPERGASADVGLTLTSGRAPSVEGEVALGPDTSSTLDAGIGDTVVVDVLGRSATVVGIALFPPEVHSGLTEGAWLSPTDFDDAMSLTITDETSIESWLALDGPRNATDRTVESINGVLASDGSGFAAPSDIPIELANLGEVRTLPVALAGFLAVLAIASLTHVLASTVRRRNRDFAVLRALGLNRRSLRLVLNAQSTSVALFGLLLGVPLGIIVGREGWRWVSAKVPLEFVAPFDLSAVLISAPAALLVVNALAIWPGRQVARMRLADQLRTE
jgi:hypothetical protein